MKDLEDSVFQFEDNQVCLEGPEYSASINGITVYAREGSWMEQDEDGEFYPDFSLTWFYTDRGHPERYFYFEQDPYEAALYNLTRSMTACVGISMAA